MIKNFLKSSIRAFRRQKVYSAINVLGLALGISVSLMLFLFVQHELSFDQFHEKGDRIFRVVSKYTSSSGRNSQNAITFGSVAPEIKKQIPEVAHATRIYHGRSLDIVYNQATFQQQKFYYADHDFFSIFSFNSLYGNHPNKPDFDNGGVVISEALANTIFGNKVPLGQLLSIDGSDYRILDVLEIPAKSHLKFDVLLSIENFDNLYQWSYQSGMDFHTYGLYAENINHTAVSTKVSQLYNGQMNDRFADFIAQSDNFVQPLSQIYLYSKGINNNLGAGSLTTIYILAAIDLLILLIAVINYVNLTTAQYEKRIKEIGVRKVIGANRKQLVFQFLGESVLLTFFAFACALALTQLVFDAFGNLMQITAKINYWSNPMILITMMLSALLLGILSGLYPALYISGFSSSKILKRDFPGVRKGTRAGKVLVAIQFIIAIVLVTNLAFLNKQIHFVKNKSLGFNEDQVLVVDNISEKQHAAYEAIAAELANSPHILQVTGSQSALGRGSSGQMAHLEGEDAKTSVSMGELRTKHNFIDTYGIRLMKGRDFSPELTTDQEAFLVNQSGAEALFPDGTDPLGQRIVVAGRTGPIVGVLEDFHYYNLKIKITPLLLSLDDPYRLQLSVKLSASSIKESLKYIETTLKKTEPDYQLSYYFVDDYFQNMYEAEERYASLITYSSLLATLISLVGLIALISHSLAKQTKEVAIRKVLGANLKQLFWVMTREFYWVILLANGVALPLSILIVRNWLPSFAYRIDIGSNWAIFLAVAIGSLITALFLIINQVNSRARANPAEILANE